MIIKNTLPHAMEFRLPNLLSESKPIAAAADIPPAPADEAHTYGWDTAFAIKLKDVNAAIAKFAVSPKAFAYTPPDKSCSIDGKFGTWRISGGDGALVHFEIPLTEGSLKFEGKDFSIDCVVATAEIRLHFLPQNPAKKSSKKGEHSLVARTDAVDSNNPAVGMPKLKFPKQTPGYMVKALLALGLQAWLNANLDQFKHIFSVVNLDRIVDHKQFQWLTPTATSYACLDGGDEDSSYLGVLCMTGNRDAAELAAQISPSAIPKGSKSGFLISKNRILDEMILPVMPHIFPDASAADFAISPDGIAVVNVKPVKTKTVENAGTTYQPWVQQLRVTINATEVVIDTLISVSIGMGATAMVKHTAYQTIKLATKPDGSQTLTWEQARPPYSNHWIKLDEGTSVATEIIATIVFAIVTALTEGSDLLVALVVVSLIVGLIEAAPKIVANVVGQEVSDESPSMNLLSFNATDPIRWSGAKEFKLDWTGLNGSLQLGGSPQFIF